MPCSQVGEHSPAERARAFLQEHPESPLSGHLAILPASSPEQEARAIDLQVRQWLLDGKQSIAIVTEDRRLARRVRALLDRAGIGLEDTGGWALSTTSAAAALERWLETVEEDFAHQPLLDVLKSPFIFPDDDRDQLANSVYRLEQDIIQRENIASGMQRYRTSYRSAPATSENQLDRGDGEPVTAAAEPSGAGRGSLACVPRIDTVQPVTLLQKSA